MLGLFDTSGSIEYKEVTELGLPQTDCFLLCYSVVDPVSFENCKTIWHPMLRHKCPEARVILVGLKSDLRTNPEAIAQLVEKGRQPVASKDVAKMSKKLRCVAEFGESFSPLSSCFSLLRLPTRK